MLALGFDFTGWTPEEAQRLTSLLVDLDGAVLQAQILTDWTEPRARQAFLSVMQHTAGNRRSVAERFVRHLLDRPVDARSRNA